MDMYENSLSVLVPSNHEMRRAILEIDFRLTVPYVHSDKTPLMRELLPHGSEHLYDLQALWDAHIYTYRQLGVKITPNGSSFGAYVYQELVDNLDYLAYDLRLSGRAEKAAYKKRFDPKDRAFRDQRFENPGWWGAHDS